MVHTRRDGGCAHRRTRNSELGVRDSEFLSVVRSTVDGLREACGALWISIPTQTGLSRYNGIMPAYLKISTSRRALSNMSIVEYMRPLST